MAVTIQIRRGTTTPSAANFATGEPAFDSTSGKLFVKNAAGAMVDVSGKMETTLLDESNATYIYFGGIKNGVWKVNRFTRSSFVKGSATQANNGSFSSLATAWSNRATLSYS